jgi:hypothetical protein
MNLDELNKNLFLKSFNIFNDELLNEFCENYLKNNNSKYELFHNYIFSFNMILKQVKDFIQGNNHVNPVHTLNEENKSKYLINGELNLNHPDIIDYCKIATHLFVGEFLWKGEICSLFLTINKNNEIYGYCIDNNINDPYFLNYKKLNLIDNNTILYYDRNDELIQNLIEMKTKFKENII